MYVSSSVGETEVMVGIPKKRNPAGLYTELPFNILKVADGLVRFEPSNVISRLLVIAYVE